MPRRDLRLVPVDPEIEKTCRQNRKSKRDSGKNTDQVDMATNGNGGAVEDQAAGLHPQERSLRDYILPSLNGVQPSLPNLYFYPIPVYSFCSAYRSSQFQDQQALTANLFLACTYHLKIQRQKQLKKLVSENTPN